MTLLAKVKIWTSFLLISLVAILLCDCGNPVPEASLPADTSLITTDMVKVVYFHREQRCRSCIYAENGVRYTLETYFEDELKSGEVAFQAINIEAKENATVVNKYGAFASSLFINRIISGTDHIEEVKETWFVLGEDEAFIEIVKGKIEESLAEIR